MQLYKTRHWFYPLPNYNLLKTQDGNTMATFEERFQGIWSMVSIINEIDGNKSEPFGSSPIGSLIITPSYRYIMVFMQANIPIFAINDRLKGTAKEYKTIAEKTFSMFGSYKISNEAEGNVSLFVDGCSFPNWIGHELERTYIINDDMLIVTVPLGDGNGINTITWYRLQ